MTSTKSFSHNFTDNVFVLFGRLSGRDYPVFYSAKQEVLRNVTLAVQDHYKSDGISIENSANQRDFTYHIRRFIDYLSTHNLEIEELTDKKLKAYIKTLVDSTLEKEKKESLSIANKRTINVYIRNIYRFIANYAMRTNNKNLIGASQDHLIKSSLCSNAGIKVDKNTGNDDGIKLYPLELAVPSKGSTTTLTKDQIITENDYLDLLNIIESSTSTIFVKERDKLIVKVARATAFRRGSIASLTKRDFNDLTEAEVTGNHVVTPLRQKFSYQLSFDGYSIEF